MTHLRVVALVILVMVVATGRLRAAELPARINCLFLGDQGHHNPADRFAQFLPRFPRRGIDLTYSDTLADLNPATLARYDVVILYANINTISDAQAAALLQFVREGKGFVPLHCASYCFRNNAEVVTMMGGQFKKHSTGVFRTRIAAPEHEVMRNFQGFESWDETYEHTLHNEAGRTVLEFREDEPYTWVRTEGKGRVFYTAWGHDEKTWSNPGFVELVERGVRWAAGRDVHAGLTAAWPTLKALEYVEQKVAYYPPGAGRVGDGVWNQMQKPLPPEESAKHMVTPGGFRVELFAAEPQIHKPITMAWDERGRCWIAESLDYPNSLGTGNDRITICEDTDGDGRADKFTVFADKLTIPTSMVFVNGGVIVHQPPRTLFLKDTDGDGKADVRQEIISGWGIRDTHAGPSNLRYALDNWVWGQTGYSGYDGSVGGEPLKFSMGFHRFKPDGTKLEFLRQTNNNTWGLGFSEEGVVFGSTANNNPSMYMGIPNRYYGWMPNGKANTLGGIADSPRFNAVTTKVRQVDVHGGYTAGAGHALYTARSYPREYWNRVAFVTEPTGHLVGCFELERHGADFKSHNPFNLLASDDEWTAPIFADIGPEGNVWVIDWYNYIVQHNPTPKGYETGPGNAYQTDLRDKQHGRIYRVVYSGGAPEARPSKPLDLSKASPADLVATLRHDNMLWRTHAQRLLVERGNKDVVPALVALVNDTSADELGLNVGAIHALWTLHGLHTLDGSDPTALAAATTALNHPSAGVRRNAAAVLPISPASTDAIIAAKLLDDTDAQVRLAALLALADQAPSDSAGAAVYAMLKKPLNEKDHWITEAATAAAVRHAKGFLAAAGPSPSDTHVHDHHAGAAPSPLASTVALIDALSKGLPTGPAAVEDEKGTTVIKLGVIPNIMRYDRDKITVKAGAKVRLVFTNNDHMQHNFLLLKPNTVDKLGAAADAMITQPDGLAKSYIPAEPFVIASIPLINPGDTAELRFIAPKVPGEFPYLCTFPGHWRIMQGVLIVE